jgi:hypothetical protein
MLIVREAQVQALQRAALPVWIASHLAHFFPLQCAVLGEAGLRERVREGIARAASHGFKTEVQISQYLDLMFAFGHDFDTDSTLSWPQPILAGEDIPAELRMERLIDAALRYRQGS